MGEIYSQADYFNIENSSKLDGIHFSKICIEITNACKYTCDMCPREKMTRHQGIMPLQDYQLVLDRVKEYVEETQLPQPFACEFSLLGYGESLLDPNLATKSAMVARQFPASWTNLISTLGVRRTESYLKNLLLEGELKNICVSFYGFQETTYNAVHKDGDFHTAEKNLIYLATLNKSLGNPCTITIQVLIPHTWDIVDTDPLEKKACLEFLKILEALGVQLHSLQLHNFGNGRSYYKPEVEGDNSVCSVVNGNRQEQLNVTWDLKILPCCLDFNADIVFGDLREQSIYEIYHGEKYQKFINSHRVGNLDNYPLCKGCDVR